MSHRSEMSTSRPAPQKGGAHRKAALIVAIAAAVAIICAIGYFQVAQSYATRFLPASYVQAAEISDMDEAQAEGTVAKTLAQNQVTLTENSNDIMTVTGADAELVPDAGAIEKALSEQDKWEWLPSLFGHENNYDIAISCDADAIKKKVEALDCTNADIRKKPGNATIEYDAAAQSFVAKEPTEGDLVDIDALTDAIASALETTSSSIINVADYYFRPDIETDSDAMTSALDRLNKIANKKITYNIDMIDDAETLTKDQIASFISVVDDLSISANEGAIKSWLREMGKKYDTVGKKIKYVTAYGKKATLPSGVIGWETDEKAMLDVVKDNLMSDDDNVDQDFKYAKEGLYPKGGTPDFGKKYVDVDISQQKTRLVKNGKVVNTFTCVTGNADGKHDTPVGVWDILEKAHNYKMSGEDENFDGVADYEVYTDTWCRFTWSGHGLHQIYRGTWAPTAYKTGAGSHGCVNLNNSDAEKVYKFVDYGTLVLVHK